MQFLESMGKYTDPRVYDAIRKLSKTKQHLSYEEIAVAADTSVMTVRRSVVRLVKANAIEISGFGNKKGYSYRLKDDYS